MGKRRLARETALQALYFLDVSTQFTPQQAFEAVRQDKEEPDEKSDDFIRSLVLGTAEHREELDARIQAAASNWAINRMSAVDRSLLRMAAYEFLHQPDTPIGAVIDEAIEIAKKYSTPESPAFVNGILDKIKDLRAPKTST